MCVYRELLLKRRGGAVQELIHSMGFGGMPPKAKKEKVKKEKNPKAVERKKKKSPIHPSPSLVLFITSLFFTGS